MFYRINYYIIFYSILSCVASGTLDISSRVYSVYILEPEIGRYDSVLIWCHDDDYHQIHRHRFYVYDQIITGRKYYFGGPAGKEKIYLGVSALYCLYNLTTVVWAFVVEFIVTEYIWNQTIMNGTSNTN